MKHQEAIEQIKVINYCDLRKLPVYHIPNGGSRNTMEAANLKRQGVRAGVPDLCFPVAQRGYHGMYIEMKAGKNSTTDAQDKWLELLKGNGYYTAVCYGFAEARKVIDWYFEEVLRHGAKR